MTFIVTKMFIKKIKSKNKKYAIMRKGFIELNYSIILLRIDGSIG